MSTTSIQDRVRVSGQTEELPIADSYPSITANLKYSLPRDESFFIIKFSIEIFSKTCHEMNQKRINYSMITIKHFGHQKSLLF